MNIEEYISWSDSRVVVRVPATVSPGPREVVLTTGVNWRQGATASLRVLRQRTLAHEEFWGLGIRTNNTVTVWGEAVPTGQITEVPAGLSDVVAVTAGSNFTVALEADGTATAWGANGAMSVPEGLSGVVDVRAGANFALALKRDGTVVAWGHNEDGQASVPTDLSNVVLIAASRISSIAIRADGTSAGWGSSAFGQFEVPAVNDLVEVSGGTYHFMALRANGTLVAWGYDEYGQTTLPANLSNVAAVAGSGFQISMALMMDGTVVYWGDPDFLPPDFMLPPFWVVFRVPARQAPSDLQRGPVGH